MLHRGIRFVHAAILAFSAVLAFLFVRGLDESTPLGTSALVDVFDSDESTSAPQVIRAVQSFATERGVGVARDVTDLKNPDSVRNLYATTGSPSSLTAEWLDSGYPAFSSNHETRVRPLSEIAQQDPRGPYYIFGSPANAEALSAAFARLGLKSSVSHPLSYAELSDRYMDDPLFQALLVVAFSALTMTGASVLFNAKAYGVLRLQGMSLTGILVRDLRQLAVFWLAAVGLVMAATLAFLGFYNSLAWLGLFASVAAAITVLLGLVALSTHAAVLALTFKVDVLRALKGELPSRGASIGVYLVRIPALLLTLSIATNVTLAGRDVLTRHENQDIYRSVGNAVSIRISGAFAANMDQVDKHVGPWLRQSDRQGKVVVAGRRDLQVSAPEAHLPSGEILIVNDSYLSKQPVTDPAGKRYTSAAQSNEKPDARPVRVIIPESLMAYAPEITKAASGIIDPNLNRNIPLKTLTSKTDQQLFGYNTGSYVYNAAHGPDEDRSLVRDPVLIAVPNGSHFLTDSAYTAYATQAGVIFPDPDDALNDMKTENLQKYINAVSPIGQKTSLDLRNSVSKLRLQIFNLAVSVIVILIAGVGACLIYARKNTQSIFARRISGWRYVATHRFILAVEAAIAIIFATRVPFIAWQQHQELKKYAANGMPAPFEPIHMTALDVSVITTLVAFEFGAVLLALALFHRRIMREGATGP
ncbi:bacteriocin-associated integral membrane family protein [Streptomyces sp. NPDC030920]|uniref:bacteriocin-associated integral membrane family protein n=1 Tax=Streptomyces sp. NPDC030920 TaxID=3365308 RepID=UPI0038508AC9